MKKGKVSIIGSGFVGATTAYTLALSGLLYEIVIVDVNKEKAEGDAMDISHGVSFLPQVNVVQGEYSDVADSDIIIITAGVSQRPEETRIDLLKRNTAVFKNILGNLLPFCDSHTIILVVTNPVDILTYITCKISGLESNRVIGSGTVLDTARLKYMIGEHAGVDTRDVQTFIIGEHGDSELAVWSHTYITGVPLDDYCVICGSCPEDERICKKEVFDDVKNAAYRIIEKKGATYYAVALCVQRIVEAILGNEHSILTVSSLFEGEYGIDGCCISAPSIIGAEGIERILEVKLSTEEHEKFLQSASILKELLHELDI